MPCRSGFFAVLLLLALALPAAAGDATLHGHIVGYLGTLDIADNPGQLVHETHKYTLGVGAGLEPASWGPYGLTFEFWASAHNYDSTVSGSLFGTVDERMELRTAALLFGPTVTTPPKFPLRAYATAGLGFFRHQLYASGSVIGLPASLEEDEKNLAPYFGGGLVWQLKPLRLSIDYRRWEVDASFNDFGVTGVDLDGELWAAGLGFAF